MLKDDDQEYLIQQDTNIEVQNEEDERIELQNESFNVTSKLDENIEINEVEIEEEAEEEEDGRIVELQSKRMGFNRENIRGFFRKFEMVFLPLVAHTIWGIYPVISRFLQIEPILIPTLALLLITSLIPFVFFFPYTVFKLKTKTFHGKEVWILGGITAFRAVTNIFAARYTLVMYIQLFALTTPFFVAILTRIFLKDSLPKMFFPCLLVSCVGSVLLFSNNFKDSSFIDFQGTRLLGLGLALLTAFALALNMLFQKVASNAHVPPFQVIMMQLFSLVIVSSGLMAFIPTDFTFIKYLHFREWFLIGCISAIFSLGNLLNLFIIEKAGASFNSAFIGLRLIVSIIGGWVVLGEELTLVWQYVGIGLILISITYFLVRQELEKKSRNNNSRESFFKRFSRKVSSFRTSKSSTSIDQSEEELNRM